MSQHVKAIYENGVLKPVAPLDLEEDQHVSLYIKSLPDNESMVSNDEYLPLVAENGDPNISWQQVQAVLAKLEVPLSEDFDRERDERF